MICLGNSNIDLSFVILPCGRHVLLDELELVGGELAVVEYLAAEVLHVEDGAVAPLGLAVLGPEGGEADPLRRVVEDLVSDEGRKINSGTVINVM